MMPATTASHMVSSSQGRNSTARQRWRVTLWQLPEVINSHQLARLTRIVSGLIAPDRRRLQLLFAMGDDRRILQQILGSPVRDAACRSSLALSVILACA